MIHHRIHSPACNPKEKSRTTELFKISQIVSPIWLRDNCHTIPFSLKNSRNYCTTKRGMIYIGITGEDNDIYILPPECLHLLFRCRQKRTLPVSLISKWLGNSTFT